MRFYDYKAQSTSSEVHGSIEALNKKHAIDELNKRGLKVLKLNSRFRFNENIFWIFIRQLTILSNQKITLAESISIISSQTDTKISELANRINIELENGKTIEATYNHRFLTQDGFKFVEDLDINNDNDNLMHLSAWSMAPDENLYSYNSVSIGSSDILTGDNKLYVQGNITASGVVTASDFRLKKDIVSLENSLDKILKLNPVTFRWKNNDTKNNIGLIAQEVEDIIPDAVNENNEIKGIQYNAITAMLVKSVQELKSENQSLKDENQDLKKKLTNKFERLENQGI